MEGMRSEIDGGEFSVGDFDAFGVFVLVEFCTHLQAGIGGGCSDQLKDGAIVAPDGFLSRKSAA